MLVHHQALIADTTACGISKEKIVDRELTILTNDNWSKVSCNLCIKRYRRGNPRIHFQPMPGSRTTCGIQPSDRRPTKVRDNWEGVTCTECVAANLQARKPVAKPSTHTYRTRHPAWEGTLADVKRFMDRYGRDRAKALVKKYVRPVNAQTRVSNIPTGYWKTMRAEIDHWMRKPVEPTIREAAWGDLYFWRRDRPNKSWHWEAGRETSQSKFHGEKWTWGSFHGGFGINKDELVKSIYDSAPTIHKMQHGARYSKDGQFVFPRGRVVGKSPLLASSFVSNLWSEDLARLWQSCPPKFMHMGTRTGRWSGKAPNLYSGKLSENLIQGSQYMQMEPRITGNHATLTIVDDPGPQTALEVQRAMEKAWRMTTMYGGKPDMIYAGDAFMDAYRKDREAARVLEGILNFNYKEMEARVNAAMTDVLLYGSASYKIDNSETPTISKENAMSNGISNPFARHFGFNPAEFVPARHGQPWDYESDARLIRFLKGGFAISEIASELGRSEVSIECRVTFLAYKEERAALLATAITKLTAEPKTPRVKAKRKVKAKAKKSRK